MTPERRALILKRLRDFGERIVTNAELEALLAADEELERMRARERAQVQPGVRPPSASSSERNNP